MPAYLAVYGLGACWSGYDAGKVIFAETDADAKQQTFQLACDYADELSPKRGGYSYDYEKIDRFANMCGNFTRLKHSAKREFLADPDNYQYIN